jgi:hypothetical protein
LFSHDNIKKQLPIQATANLNVVYNELLIIFAFIKPHIA